ncbi:MAG: hypothetical protein H7Y28_06810 [Rhodoferax sp.]|nr:hypothetical protein [Rhodoferax sp.]
MDHSDAISQQHDISDRPHFIAINSTFPELGHKIRVFWGHPEFTALMLNLQQDTSDRPRFGFPQTVMHALQQLELDHDSEFPHLRREIPSFWQTL